MCDIDFFKAYNDAKGHLAGDAVLRCAPSMFCYRPDTELAVGEPPCLRQGFITFGSFNALYKIGPACIAAWSRILGAVPDSRLHLLGATAAAPTFKDRFAALGIDPERVDVLPPTTQAAVMARFSGATDYAAFKDVDLVIEAVFEDMAVKHAVFAELDRHCKPGAVLATNTSYLDIDAIAQATSRPQDVIGLHFFSPANIMKLLEIVVPAQVSADVVATAFALATRLKKVPVRAGVCDGFIGNRILAIYRTAADHLMEDGASPYEIDAMVRAFGFPMGPYEMSDLAGGDIGWATRKRRAATRDPKARYVHIADQLCERGWFGQKTGRGWYLYEAGSRSGQPDPEVEAIVAEARAKAGVTPRHFTPEEMQRRYVAAMVNEGAKVVEEGIALRPLDVDVTLVHGYGFPRWRGGPMKHADQVGLGQILADIQAFAQEDPQFWQPSALLVKLVAEGKTFDSLNKI